MRKAQTDHRHHFELVDVRATEQYVHYFSECACGRRDAVTERRPESWYDQIHVDCDHAYQA